MGETEDVLGLSLSLRLGGCGVNQSPVPPLPALKVNPMQKPPQPQHSVATKNKSSWNDLFRLPPDGSSDTRSFLGAIDMNSEPLAVAEPVPDCDDDNGDNSTVSSGSKRSEREEDNAGGAAVCSRGSDDEDGGGGDTPRKKLRLTKEQSMLLEETFKQHNTLNPKQKEALAKELNLRPRQVEVWFQNRRARTKLKQTEVDCEYLKRCCENLTEENRRLHKEVQELRALKLSPQLYMHMNPPTTLTMCPSCERVAASSASSSSATAHLAAAPPSNCGNLLGPNIRRPVAIKPWKFEGSISRP